MPNSPSRRAFLTGLAGAAATPIVARRATAQTPVTVKYMTW